jgi:hypothetical protein
MLIVVQDLEAHAEMEQQILANNVTMETTSMETDAANSAQPKHVAMDS